MTNDKTEALLRRVADALERLAPGPSPEPDFATASLIRQLLKSMMLRLRDVKRRLMLDAPHEARRRLMVEYSSHA